MISVALACALVALAGCSTASIDLNPTIHYRFDMPLAVNGKKVVGMGVVAKAASYAIAGSIQQGAFDYLIVRSCHRDRQVEDLGQAFGYTYTPRPGVEDNRECPLQILGFEKLKGRDSEAFIEFQDPALTLEAALECDGARDPYTGVSACQSAVGLTQRIIFPVETIGGTQSPGCEIPRPADLKTYEFKIQPGLCVMAFRELGGAHRGHRLTTYGYSESVPRNGAD